MDILLSKEAAKHLKHLPKTEQLKIKRKLLILQEDPLSGKKLSGEISGSRSLRAWPYRIVYKINLNQKSIEVTSILHRQGAYK